MIPHYPVISGRKVVVLLGLIGFDFASQRGSHVKLRNESGRTVIVPMHNELAIGTLKSILRQADLDEADFLKLFKM